MLNSILFNPSLGASSTDIWSMISDLDGHLNRSNFWQQIAGICGGLVLVVAIIFTAMAVMRSRDKSTWWWRAAIAWVIGGILVGGASVATIKDTFGKSWSNTFNGKGTKQDGTSTIVPLKTTNATIHFADNK